MKQFAHKESSTRACFGGKVTGNGNAMHPKNRRLGWQHSIVESALAVGPSCLGSEVFFPIKVSDVDVLIDSTLLRGSEGVTFQSL